MKKMLARKRLLPRGDTIAEVLICCAVISAVAIGAFVLSQQSTRSIISSQENSEASQIVLSQIEILRSLTAASPSQSDPIFSVSPKFFCIDNRQPGNPVRHNFDSNFQLPSLANDPFNYPTPCKSLNGRYNIVGYYTPSSHTFTFLGRWEKFGGEKTQVSLTYRIHPGIPFAATPSPVPPPTPTTPGCPRPAHVVLTLDHSTSMTAEFATGVSRVQKLHEVSRAFIQNIDLGTTTRASIVKFNETASIAQSMTTSQTALINALGSLATARGTKYIPALQATSQAIAGAPSTDRRIVVFISDGQADQEAAATILAANTTMKNSGIVFYTIAITNSFNSEVLQQMATSGNFAMANDPAALSAIMQDIAEDIRCP